MNNTRTTAYRTAWVPPPARKVPFRWVLLGQIILMAGLLVGLGVAAVKLIPVLFLGVLAFMAFPLLVAISIAFSDN